MVKLRKTGKYRYEIPKTGGMLVPGVIYASEKILPDIQSDNAPNQVENVAHLPGIVGASMAMPDIHWGYGFPIGGVAATDATDGVISPGGVGYDINCGVRLATLKMDERDIKPHVQSVIDALFSNIPVGIGRGGDVRLGHKELGKVLRLGAGWAVKAGFGERSDLSRIESRGAMSEADSDAVTGTALDRGRDQVGTLGSGNHFIELGVVEEIYDPETAETFGLSKGQVTLMIHSGSRGLGYQVCDDSLARMVKYVMQKKIDLPDRQLACAHFASRPGQLYFAGMAAAANYAWANRQVLMALAGRVIARSLGMSEGRLGMSLLYDVCHNIAKVETHTVKGRKRKLVVHRKGATRSFGPGSPDLAEEFRYTGQPVLIPGDMGRASYVLAGTQVAMEQTFGSTCHGAGRLLSRKAAIKRGKGRRIDQELAHKGIIVRARGRNSLAEEMPEAYKNVADVVDVVHGAGLSRKVARLRPIGVVKG
jgi:tRNA-splicing ligase RtcB (3'-phosphate/5'-hydroxy nucleic acid ligase)